MSERGFCSEHNYEWWGEDRCPLCTIAIQAALIEVLGEEQVAWRKFTDEANNTMDSAEATIATQAAAIEALEAKYDQAQKRVEELFEIIADCDDSVAKFKLARIEEAG